MDQLDDLTELPIKISSNDNLTIFDNRLDSKWQLKFELSILKSKTRTLSGDCHYKSKSSTTINIPITKQFKTI